jgi:hypothetical protein
MVGAAGDRGVPKAVESRRRYASSMRLVWWVIGVGAAVLLAMNALFLVGFTAMEVVSPDAIESSGTSPWLVVTPRMLGLFVVARWSLRRAGGPPRDGPDAGPPATSALQGWVEAHPMLSAAIAGGAAGSSGR